MTTDEADLHTLTGAYAVDALAEHERRAFERHLRACEACSQEVRELRATAARLGGTVAEPPPARLRERVLAAAARTRQLPPEPAPTIEATTAGPAGTPWYRQPLGVAASVLLAVALALGALAAVQQRRVSDAELTAQRITAIVSDPERVDRTVPVEGGGTGTVVAAGGEAVFLGRDLGAVPDDRTYQLWVVTGDTAASAGVLDTDDGTAQAFVPDVAASDALAVSVEPVGGSEQPTPDAIVAVLPLGG